MKYKHYTKETKLAVIRELESGKTTAQVCREHEVNIGTVRRWRLEHRHDPERAFSGHGKPNRLETENAELQRAVGRLYVENEFLKKVLDSLRKKLSQEKNE